MRPEWSDASLDRMRGVSDPQAEALVAAMGRARTGDYLRALDGIDNRELEGPLAQAFPQTRELLAHEMHLPADVDLAAMSLAAKVYWNYYPAVILSMLFGSLLEGYAAAEVSAVLRSTGRLEAAVTSRVERTERFVSAVMSEEAFLPHGAGYVELLRARLIHAHLNVHGTSGSGHAPRLPVCQEDMLGTVMGFSLIVLDGLARLGVELSPRESQVYLYRWNVLGRMMGVRAELLPSNVCEAAWLMQQGRRRHYRANEDGRVLARALMDYASTLVLWSPSACRSVGAWMVGPEVARMVGLRVRRTHRPLIAALARSGALSRAIAHSPLAKFARMGHRRLVDVRRVALSLLPSRPSRPAKRTMGPRAWAHAGNA